NNSNSILKNVNNQNFHYLHILLDYNHNLLFIKFKTLKSINFIETKIKNLFEGKGFKVIETAAE
ncbi:hypothetical protein LCGC14_2644670, partial [marine sediment metagenome]